MESSGIAQLFREAQRRACLQLWFSSAHGAKTVDPRLSDPELCRAQILEKGKALESYNEFKDVQSCLKIFNDAQSIEL